MKAKKSHLSNKVQSKSSRNGIVVQSGGTFVTRPPFRDCDVGGTVSACQFSSHSVNKTLDGRARRGVAVHVKAYEIGRHMISSDITHKACYPVRLGRQMAVLGFRRTTDSKLCGRVLASKCIHVLRNMGVQNSICVEPALVGRRSWQSGCCPILGRGIHLIPYLPLRFGKSLVDDDVFKKRINVLVISSP